MPTIRKNARRWMQWGGVGAALLTFGLLSCKEAVMEPLTVASVEVAGGGASLRLGQSTQLNPTLKSAKGLTLPTAGVTWSSSDAAKATVSPSGQVTGVARGPVTLTASAGGVNGTAAVTVIGVQSVSLAPDTVNVIVTQSRALTVSTVLDPGVTVTPTYRSLDTLIARVDATGRVTATATTGVARIEVTAEDKRDTAVVRVVPVPVASVVVSPATATINVGASQQLTATVRDSAGGTLTGRVVTWSSLAPSIVSTSPGGLVSGVSAGSTVISASSEGFSGSSVITVSNSTAVEELLAYYPLNGNTVDASPRAASGTIVGSVSAVSNRVGTTSQAMRFADGHINIGAFDIGSSFSIAAWIRYEESGDPRLAQVILTNQSSNLQLGVLFVLVPCSDGNTEVAGASCAGNPNRRWLRIHTGPQNIHNTTTQLTATGTYLNPNQWYHSTVTFDAVTRTSRLFIDGVEIASRSNMAIPSLSTDPFAIGRSSVFNGGPFWGDLDEVRLYRGAISPALVAQLAGPVVSSLEVTPANTVLVVGAAQQLAATTKDAGGNVLTGRTVTWSSSAPSIVRVSNAGVLTAVAVGSATISVICEGKSATASVTVVPESGLIAWYPFDGSAADISGNNRNGTILAATPDIDRFGNVGKALSFDGISGGVATPIAILDIQQDYTVSLWFKMAEYWAWSRIGNGEADGLILTNPHNSLAVGFDYQVQGRFANAFGNGSSWLRVYGAGAKTDWTKNIWYHLIVRKSGNTYTTFIDGIVDHSTTLASISTSVLVQLNFGGGWSFPDNPGWGTINGSIDEVKVFSRALSNAEVSALAADRP